MAPGCQGKAIKMCKIEQLVATCKNACLAGGKQLTEWQGKFSTKEKSAQDLVTDADIASQEAVRRAVEQEFPEHGFLGEESPDLSQLEKPYCWVVDPLDGTTNYVHGFPCFGVSVAVARAGELVAGGVYDPTRNEMFLAGKGVGATLNDKSFLASKTSQMENGLVAVSFPPQMTADMPDIQAFLKVAPRCRAVRRTGSAALNLAYVACGRLDAHWAYHIFPWDSAAGVLLVEEAGGTVSAASGEPYDLSRGNYMVASTAKLHEQILSQIAS